MKPQQKALFTVAALIALVASVSLQALAQDRGKVLAGAELTRVVPAAFYFQGQSAPTQMRNSAAARFGANRHVIVGMVDTSGYSAEIRARYEGFFITDSNINVGGETLSTGAYGFGFSNDGKLNILDLAGNQILSVATTNDKDMRRPRPLMMSVDGAGVRLYRGRDYVLIAAK
jgi:hypothetical protein